MDELIVNEVQNFVAIFIKFFFSLSLFALKERGNIFFLLFFLSLDRLKFPPSNSSEARDVFVCNLK